jgi:hypothetical protein
MSVVLYGWLEDRDFGLLSHSARVGKCAAPDSVHMGVKSGRVAGDRLRLWMFPIYMMRKGTDRWTGRRPNFRNVASLWRPR